MFDKKSLIAHANPKSPVSEAYRVLRTNIQFSSIDKPLKVITVTSSGPGEGKSTTIANLAITFAQSGSRALLIDADLRKPRVHKIFGMDNTMGLTSVLTQHKDYKEFLQPSLVPGLDILTCGVIPPNPSELLASNSMKQFIHDIRDEYDAIFLDAPPIGTVTDAAILSTIVDGTILVAASGTVEIDAVQRSKELLEKVNANLLGVVLNKLDKNSSGNNYYYNYYYYGEDEQSTSSGRRKRKAKGTGRHG